MLQLTNLRKSYSRRLVLDIPSLQLAGGIYWIKGANGSGKTTLLKMIAGLIPFEGDILFRDISLKNKVLDYRRMVSWAEAEPLFPDFLTGAEVVSLYQEIRGVPQSSVDHLLAIFAMTSYIHTPIGTYSAGMTKKLSLVLAFLGDCPVMLLDEPLITLDDAALLSVGQLIGERSAGSAAGAGTGTIFLMSSHQQPDKSLLELLPASKELIVDNQTISN